MDEVAKNSDLTILNRLIHAVGRVCLMEWLDRYFLSEVMAFQSRVAERTHKDGFNIGTVLVCFPVAVTNVMSKGGIG